MSHINTLSRTLPAKAESLLVVERKVGILGGFAEALAGLAEAAGAWQEVQDHENAE